MKFLGYSLSVGLSTIKHVHGKSYFPGDEEYIFAIAETFADCPIRCPDEAVVPSSVGDVVEAVQKARGANSSVQVRCGGHSMWCQWARGSGTLIDLRSLNSLEGTRKGACLSRPWSCFLEERDFRMAECAVFESRPYPLSQLRSLRTLVKCRPRARDLSQLLVCRA